MGVSSSKIEDEKALLLCRDRKHFVKQAIDGRCSLAAAHVSYIQSLRNTGIALRKFVEPEVPTGSSLYTSTSATPEPLALTDKSVTQFSNSSPSLSQHVDVGESFSPVPSPRSSGRFRVNHMKAGRSFSTTVEEKLPIPVTATLQTSTAPKPLTSQSDENSLLESPLPPPGTPLWDYFGLFHPIDNQFSPQDGRELNLGLDNNDDIRRLREEEGIPELEEEGEKASTNGRDDFADSEDDFDQQSSEPLVRMFRNRNVIQDHHLGNDSPAIPSVESVASGTQKQNGENNLLTKGKHETDETPELTPSKMASSAVVLCINGKVKEQGPEIKFGSRDLLSCMKELEDLFLKAFDCGREVPRMLEASEVNFRPLFPEEIAHMSKASVFLTACFACCKEEVPPQSQVPAPNDIKQLTWHKSVSSHSSSSRNPLGATSKDDIDDLSSNLFSSRYMNSGSHALTLDRLYAWERKLYDEIKASGLIRREYDMKCRLLRHQESRGEKSYSIDKTRAAVKDLHSRIRVAIQRIDSISKRIEELRDKELQPQLKELIGGFTQMWAMMLDCHKNQCSIISGLCNNSSTKVSTRSESHRQAAILLEFELSSLCSNFTKWISTQKFYLEAINGWLRKCVSPLRQKSSRRRPIEFDPKRDIAPPIFVACQDWLTLLNNLPTKEVADAMQALVTVTTYSLPRQEKGHENSKLSLTFSMKARQSVGLEDVERNESPEDWCLNYDRLRSGLVVFLNQLKTFAESSVREYEILQESIDKAHFRYENSGLRM